MSPIEVRALCVSIHDVAPATWEDCARLAAAIRDVADIPLTFLVVPHYHRGGGSLARMEAQLELALARGDELALHGYTHRDSAAPGRGLRERFLRAVYTRREGEFAALSAPEAERRIRLGLDWFAARGWPVHGFVPPAWLMGEGGWQALRSFPFEYSTTFTRFHLLPHGPALFAPSLVYAARNRAGRALSPVLASATGALLVRAPLVRLSLHPADVQHPRLLHHAQQLVARLAAERPAMTKLGWARVLTSTGPSSHRASSPDPIQGRRNNC